MSVQNEIEIQNIALPVWGGKLKLNIKRGGNGPPLVFLHNASGPRWDAFLDELSRTHTVFAIEHPGTSDDDSDAIDHVHELWDLVLIYEEAIRGLQLEEPVVVGASAGGMLAAELSASFPALFSKVLLIAPAGLWREDPAPREWLTSDPGSMPGRLFKNLSNEHVVNYMTPPNDPAVALKQRVRATWSMGCTGKFLWPLPDRGLRRRLHRISAPTLIIWGADDDITPTVYAQDFGQAIAGSSVKIVQDSGHVVQIEQRDAVVAHVLDFLRTL